jgi:hypothetical protein
VTIATRSRAEGRSGAVDTLHGTRPGRISGEQEIWQRKAEKEKEIFVLYVSRVFGEKIETIESYLMFHH